MNLNLHEIHKKLFSDPSTKVLCDLSLINYHTYLGQVEISNVFHNNGLFLCTTFDNKLVVWNPCTGQTRWIKLSSSQNCKACFALGYEKNKSFLSYKILSYIFSNDYVDGFEIYEFTSNSWRVFDDVTTKFCIRSEGVSLMGNIYWFASENIFSIDLEFMVVFDFTKEKFRRLTIPQHFPYGIMNLSVMSEDKLLIWHQCFIPSSMEILVLIIDNTDHTKLLSWRKFLEIDPSYNFHIWSSLFLDLEKKFAMCCILKGNKKGIVHIFGEDDKHLEIPFQGDLTANVGWRQFTSIYVPSLVQF